MVSRRRIESRYPARPARLPATFIGSKTAEAVAGLMNTRPHAASDRRVTFGKDPCNRSAMRTRPWMLLPRCPRPPSTSVNVSAVAVDLPHSERRGCGADATLPPLMTQGSQPDPMNSLRDHFAHWPKRVGVGRALLLLAGLLFLLVLAAQLWRSVRSQGFASDELLMLGATVIAVLGVLWVVVRILRGLAAIFGPTPYSRVVSLGITVAVLPDFIVGPANALGRTLHHVLNWIPYLVQLWLEESPRAARDTGDMLAVAVNLFAFPLRPFFWGLALWALIGHALGAPSGIGRLGSAFVDSTRRLSTKTWQNIGAVLTILAGVYLSIAAIAAIPHLQETTIPAEVNAERLKQRLQEAGFSQGAFDAAFPKTLLVTDPYARLRPLIGLPPLPAAQQPQAETGGGNTKAPSDTAAKEPVKPSPPRDAAKQRAPVPNDAELIEEAQRLVSGKTAELGSLRQNYQDAREQMWQSAQRFQQNTTTWFEVSNVGRSGVQDRAQYFLQLYDAYFQRIEQSQRRLRGCLAVITQFELAHSSFADRLAKLVHQPSGVLPWDEVPATQPEACRVDTTWDLFSPPSPGETWGPFKYVTGWLLKTQSIALATIAGMLGAGLLGSALAGVRAAAATSEVLVDDLGRVLIRGFSAAILVYMAFKAGLVIVSFNDQSEPNPYVLLVVCFVATVFNEDVWRSAGQQLGTYLARSGRHDEAQENQPGVDTGGTPPTETQEETDARTAAASSTQGAPSVTTSTQETNGATNADTGDQRRDERGHPTPER